MQRQSSNPSTSVRDAKIAILATVLSSYFGRQIAMTTILTWRGWSEKPAWLWRPFTIVSLWVAVIAASCWPFLFRNHLYESIFGESFFTPTPQAVNRPEYALVYVTVCYIFWS